MNQQEFEDALKVLLRQPLTTTTFEQVKPVAEALLYSEFLPNVVNDLNRLQKKRLVFLLEKFRRYSCATVTRRQQLKTFSNNVELQNTTNHKASPTTHVDPLAKKIGLNEDLNHMKSHLLSLQTRHYVRS